MICNRLPSTVLRLGLVACLMGPYGLACAEEPPKIVHELDFNACDPVKLQGAIMTINPGHRTLTVAEKEIRMMDVGSDDRRLKTVMMGIDGKPEIYESFKIGQPVMVEGFDHPDGFVAAAKIQKLDAVQAGRKKSPSKLQQTHTRRNN